MEDNQLEKVNLCAMFLVKTLCVDTNATEAKYTLEKFNREGEILGDYELLIRKK